MDDVADRLAAELDLLQAMYPEALTYSPTRREVKYRHHSVSDSPSLDGGILVLRIPDTYPVQGLPTVISATGPSKIDLRSPVTETFGKLNLTLGEEALDVYINAFQDVLSSQTSID